MINLINQNITKVLSVFSVSPGSRLNRKIIQEKTGINNIILDKIINQLINFRLLSKEKNLLFLNFKNPEVGEIIELMTENHNKLRQLPLKEYFMILDILEELSIIKGINDVYLFGSYSKLVFNENSDIDFAIISNDIDKKLINRKILKMEKWFKKKIEIHFFTKEFYKNKRDPLVKEILKNGVKLI